MDFSIFVSPLSADQISLFSQGKNSLGEQTTFFSGEEIEEGFDLAIVGVKESRGGNIDSVKESPDYIREKLYSLFVNNKISLLDLGNIEEGETKKDTFFALSEITAELITKNIIPIVLGGSQDLTLGLYKAFEKIQQVTNITSIDRKIDLKQTIETTSDSYLKDIVLSQPNFLFNYSNLGSQSYYLDPELDMMMETLYFENIRLGQLQKNIELAEPVVRNTNILSFDLNSIRQSEVPGTSFASPNGFFGNEACQIMRYAGMSDKLNVLGIFEMTPEFDIHNQTSHLVAQMIWHFIEGFQLRKNETPLTNSSNYTKYKVVLTKSEEELIFLKSKKSGRWWMKIPYPPSKKVKYERHHLVPCSYEDYLTAQKDEMPNVWLKTYNKININ